MIPSTAGIVVRFRSTETASPFSTRMWAAPVGASGVIQKSSLAMTPFGTGFWPP